MGAIAYQASDFGPTYPHDLFERIANDLRGKGYSIQPQAIPPHLVWQLTTQVRQIDDEFAPAGVGRRDDFQRNQFIRRDEICWINGDTATGQSWLDWTAQLQQFLNRRLFLGLFSFESHYAHYAPGDFYKRHYDAFRGQANRVLTVVAYLNGDWQSDEGGEMVLYLDDTDQQGIKVLPALGTVAIFLSEEFPHEVLCAKRHRYSIAGWYRLNNSLAGRIDPPR
ncbi:2OG-Fe(II) oxygenase [Celerinatantimonas yamalensis]|uniref:2OG-Fe(II) oxygenase n=1 Tax=Celerinatantimonas yamalensis TaxID=559956 RepID=A0ABW9GDI1_9GAMM